ncbi:efflux RND transporter permease subunit [Pelagibaculum spongiae]|uniref:Efflux pump membrane transporter n=1 Tax=Pelagibaculum spongiae TaxID=2080658 RepID=A0A2V1GTJ1_9GAMM|nr:multidrug efflux RND transporter permease subunit [Pelagibaculum spongiae]PVZ65392.1 hydrophobe/amphiphile efflux-1 family RND transporter [Pelagibaculum spongiae]
MFSHFFIKRPRFALVISIVITLAGILSLLKLPIAQFPEISPPQISVTAFYPGASAQVVEEAVIKPLEQQINGVEDMLYIESTASNDGSASITITFRTDTDAAQAQVNVQNRVAIAENKLPQEVTRSGVTVRQQSSAMLLGINLVSDDPAHDGIFLSNYTSNNIVENMARIPGVANAQVLGERTWSMRVWLNPDRMAALGVTISDLRSALQEQNVIVAAGKLGAGPVIPGQQFEYSIQTRGRLQSVDEFKQVIVRANPNGSSVHLKDVARIELGAKTYTAEAFLDNSPTAFLVIYQQPNANALDVAAAAEKEMQRLSKAFPKGIEYKIIFDTTKFIRASISEVVITLLQAIALVILVVFLFLQNIRATLIPALAIPVSLVGTFAVMSLLGYSINTITLFGLVLAIGVVVDDAIVVIENVERLITEEKMQPIEATKQAMTEISGPIIATTLVLLAVFVPVAFMPGLTGKLYTQFAVTISVAVLISSLNALTLSPALCALLLKPGQSQLKWLAPFERLIKKMTGGYSSVVASLLRRSTLIGVLFLGLLATTGYMLQTTPTGFVPYEDQGYFMVDVQLPDAASGNRTAETLKKVSAIISEQPGVAHVVSVSSFSLLSGAGSNGAMAIAILDDWEDRPGVELNQFIILGKLQAQLNQLAEARVIAFPLPPIPGLGSTGGFDFRLQDTSGKSPQELAQVMGGLINQANSKDELTRVNSSYRANIPQYQLNINRNKAKALGVPLSDIFLTLQTQLGSLYINDFNLFGRSYQVTLQAESQYRAKPSDLQHFYVRNKNNEMVPLNALASLEPVQGPTSIKHYNLYRSASINGSTVDGYSSGDAIRIMSELADQLPDGYSYQWSGQSLQEIESGSQAPFIFALALLFVYLFLVAQYESWNIPFAVLGAVPIAILGAFIGLSLFRLLIPSMSNDVYAQIGMVLLIGISSKTAILIVEFAVELRAQGQTVFEAALNAAKLRFRAVLMTALSFVLGVLPLVLASGAGASSRRSLGVVVLFGMMLATILGTLLVPVFYQIIQNMRDKVKGKLAKNTKPETI